MFQNVKVKSRIALLLAGGALALCPALAGAQPTAVAVSRPAAVPAARATRPNFVIILADDLGFADPGFNGRREFPTPNLDRLARQGTVFSRFYAGGVICGPSRASLLTGRNTIHHGVSSNSADLPRQETTIAEALKPLGYHTGIFGKWHGGRPRPGETGPVHPMDQGFDEFIGFQNAVEAWEHFPASLWFGHERRPVHGFSADLVTDYGIDFLHRNSNKPFFLYLAYIEPHLKLEAPQEDIARNQGKVEEYDPKHPYNATYAAMIERFDAAVGRFLDALDKSGQADNTIVVLSSDHGATFESGNLGASADLDSNRPFRGGKRSVFEGGTRVPTVIRWPGEVPAGRRSDDVLSQIDILPTFMAAAGSKPAASWGVDGQDELAAWEGKAKPADRTLFWEYRDEGWYNLAAMRGDWKLVVSDRKQMDELPKFELTSREGVVQAQNEFERRFEQPEGSPAQDKTPARSLESMFALFGTTDSPQLYNVRKDPDERRSYFFTRPEISSALRADLLQWMSTESAASKQAFETPSPPPVPGGPD